MMKSGYTIVFGGSDFSPEGFLRSSSLKPEVIHRGDKLLDGRIAEESWLEFFDIHEGKYPLDAKTEAMDFLKARRDEFIRLSSFQGVSMRNLNFFGDGASCMEIYPEDIALLHELSIHVSIFNELA
jgi:hypothetical protein